MNQVIIMLAILQFCVMLMLSSSCMCVCLSIDKSSDCFLFVFNQDEANGANGGSTSSSEDEVISMCKKNLKMATDFVYLGYVL